MRNWIRKAGIPATAALAVVLSGCDLEVLNPGAIQDADLNSPDLMGVLVNGVSSEYNDFQDDLAFDIAILADEASGTGSYSTTQLYRTGFYDNRDSEGNWAQTHESRWSAEQAIERLQEVLGSDYGSNVDAARAWVMKGFANVRLGENFCYAIYNVTAPQPRSAAFDSAIVAFQTAIGIAQAAGSNGDAWELAALAGIAQARLNKAREGTGTFADASSAAAAAITAGADLDWVDAAIYDQNADVNLFWTETWGRAEYGVYNTLAERMANGPDGIYQTADDDPRVEYLKCGEWDDDPPVLGAVTATSECGGSDGSSGAHQGADGQHAHYRQNVYTERGSDIPRASGAEMRLIQAEAAFEAGDLPTFNGHIAAVRAHYGLPATPAATVGTFNWPNDVASTEAADILDRERYATLWLQGRRLYDMDKWDMSEFFAGGPAIGIQIVGGVSVVNRARCMPIPNQECLLNPEATGTAACSG